LLLYAKNAALENAGYSIHPHTAEILCFTFDQSGNIIKCRNYQRINGMNLEFNINQKQIPTVSLIPILAGNILSGITTHGVLKKLDNNSIENNSF